MVPVAAPPAVHAAAVPVEVDVVVPTIGRPSLDTLLRALAEDVAAPVLSLTLVDDRPRPDRVELARRVASVQMPHPWRVVATGGRGPAAARNAGWRAGWAPWVVFLDDDVVPQRGWGAALVSDIVEASRRSGTPGGDRIGAVAGRVSVPLPEGRPPTDWERCVGGLATAPGWLTADLAVRRQALEAIGGLDERFPRAYREDTDLELRARGAGWQGMRGDRRVVHPVGPASPWASVRRQRGNADDVLMAAVHGRGWRDLTGEPPGAFRRHVWTVAAGAAAPGLAVAGHRRLALAATALWAARTARFAWQRIAPGPRNRREVTTMALTSVAIPPAAVAHRARAWCRWRMVA
jgi:hypothetical protein